MVDPNSQQETEAPQEEPLAQESSSPEQAQEQEAASPDADGEEAAQEEAQADAPDAEPDSDEPAASPEPDKHKRVGGYQRKIDRLERQLEQALAIAQGRGPQQPPQAAEPPKTEQEKAVEGLRAFAREEFQREYQREAQERHRQQAFQELEKQKAAARTRYRDFDEALEDVSDIPVPAHVQEAILLSDDKAEIMYRLAKSPVELARISALPPLVAAREIGKLEAKFASGAAPQKPKPAARPPAPPSKVGGTSSSTRDLEALPLSEYKRRMRSGGR